MCGIAGLFDTRERAPVNADVLRAMTGSLAHRGPDADGFHVEDGVGLGHRRLSIIDIAGGAQPFFNDAGTVALTYNGEVYNFQALRDELRALGHSFSTNSDTEVIVKAWEAWGEACVERFNGMFALGVYDRGRQSLFLARDRLGIKPLYYGLLPNGLLAFGSELKALLRVPELDRSLDPLAVEDYFAYGYVPEPRTILTAVKKLPPGYTLTATRGEALPAPMRYWNVSFERAAPASDADIEAEIRHRVTESVKLRMIADVPLGAFLSGGVDSSAVVATMAQLKDAAVNTCSISFGDPKFNESAFAQQVAERFETDHEVRQVDPADFDLIDRLVDFYDEPYADSSAMPTYRVCELARAKVTVALSGDGGDENFAGYRRYRWHAYEERVRRLLPPGLRGPFFGLAGRLYPKLDWAPKVLRAKSTLQALARDSLEGYFHSVS
ncbi:MAG: asparagine synthase (glutamine-hydrolyzing), partial [Pseudomonadota bacterium]